jgi:hypothetical protein
MWGSAVRGLRKGVLLDLCLVSIFENEGYDPLSRSGAALRCKVSQVPEAVACTLSTMRKVLKIVGAGCFE